MQFRVIVVTDTQTHTNKQDRLQYTALPASMQCKNEGLSDGENERTGQKVQRYLFSCCSINIINSAVRYYYK